MGICSQRVNNQCRLRRMRKRNQHPNPINLNDQFCYLSRGRVHSNHLQLARYPPKVDSPGVRFLDRFEIPDSSPNRHPKSHNLEIQKI